MSDEDYRRGRLTVAKQIIGAGIMGGVGMLREEGMTIDEAAEYLHDIVERIRKIPQAFDRLDTLAQETVADAERERFIADALNPFTPSKKND
jgi:hypothetical protein